MGDKVKKYSNFIVLGFLVLIWFGLSFYTGAFFSGFSTTDDPYILELMERLTNNGFWATHSFFQQDVMHLRFKPLTVFFYLLKVKAFGLNYGLWAFYTTSLGVLSSFLLFLASKKLDFSVFESLFITLITFIGHQMLVWYHLGYDESQGMFFFSLALFFMALGLDKNNPKEKLFNTLFIVFYTMTFFLKEVFILTVPAILLLRTYFYKNKRNIGWIEALKHTKYLIIYFLALMSLLLLAIKLFVGTNNGYAGISNTSFMPYIYTAYELSMIFRIVLVIFLIWLTSLLINKDRTTLFNAFLNQFLPVLCIFLLFVIPQIIIFAKSGFYPRYLLPVSFAYAFLSVFLLRFTRLNDQKIASELIVIVFILFIGIKSTSGYAIVNKYAKNNFALNKTIENVYEHTNKDSKILVVSNLLKNYEQATAMNTYLRAKNRTNITFLPIFFKHPSTYTNREQKLFQGFLSKHDTVLKLDEIKRYESIIIFSYAQNRIEEIYKNYLRKYEKTNYGYYSVYNKK